jgi:hypothetical protein
VAERPEATDLIAAVSNAFKRNGSDARPPAAPAISANQRQLLDTIERQRKALRQLRESHEDLTKKVEALEKRTKSLLGVFDQLNALPEQRQALESQVSSARIQQVAGVIGNVQAAAFGDAGSIFTRNNLFLAGNQLFWIFLDPVLRRLGVIGGTSPNIITWLAPVGSLVTGQIALANQQHVRFISGVATVTPPKVTFDVLRDRVADGFYQEFQRRTDIAVTAVVLDNAPFVPFAEVREGVLRVGVTPIGGDVLSPPDNGDVVEFFAAPAQITVRVAWVVDTGAGRG